MSQNNDDAEPGIKVEGNGSFGRADNSHVHIGNIYHGWREPEDPVEPAAEEASAPGNAGNKGAIGAVAFLGLVVAICLGAIFAPDPKPSFPKENGQRPAGATDAVILEAALLGLKNCAEAVVLEPVNCPQAVDDWGGAGEQKVDWDLHGNPGQGAVVAYNGEEGRFHVLGTAVMTASYKTTEDRELQLRIVDYWARVEWTGGKARLAEIRQYDESPKPSTPKVDPGLTPEVLLPLVRDAFKGCVLAKRSPLPPECPRVTSVAHTGAAKWYLNGDPTINAKARFDAKTGLIHVVGNYSMTCAYNVWLLGPTSAPGSGKYDAVISVDGGKPTVLMVAAA